MMLVTRRALDLLIADLSAAADACASLVDSHRSSIEPGRTLLQQALPLTFGLKAAGWLAGLDGALADLRRCPRRELAVQFGGAVGTLASLGDRGLDVAGELADQLGLPAPELPWHTVRLRPARIACALGATLGVMGKIGRDVVLLAQTEVAEVSEGGGPGRGGSSTMPHKRNPVGAIGLVACAQRGPGLVATMFAAMAQEHERGAGTWQAEWETLPALLRLTGSAAALVRELLAGLEVDPEKMRADMDLTGALVMSESVAAALAPALGRADAQDLVERAARESVESGRPFRDVLLESAVTGFAEPGRALLRARPGFVSGGHGRADRPGVGGASCRLKLHHEFRGKRGSPALVFTGSLGTDLTMWVPQAELLKPRFCTLRYDIRGHGRSPVPPGPYSIDDLGSDLLAFSTAWGSSARPCAGCRSGG